MTPKPADARSAAEPCELLGWDTEFFGFPVARLRESELRLSELARLDDWCAEHRVRLLYCFARPDDAETTTAATAGGFVLTDVRMTLRCDLGSERNRALVVEPFRRATQKDGAALEALSAGLFRDSRFYFDPGIPPARADELFVRWIRRSVNDERGVVFVAAGPTGDITAFVTCSRSDLNDPHAGASIGLLGVSPEARGRGIGRALVDAALGWAADEKATGVTVVTQGRNLGSQRLYARCGFLPQQIQLVYHKCYDAAVSAGAAPKRRETP